ncbi:MAG: hypothetical protein GY833_22245 [Aestuariibacter sp.]|nr:hypothetical protein [Aestuariibacter sp.]|tara:strand:+ start:20661 stop:21485 length:825 start_codon:yes stop_codon:yes gene_type:complete
MNRLSPVGNALFESENALHELLKNAKPDFMLFEGLNIKQLVDSANDFRSPKDNFIDMRNSDDPIWDIDEAGKELTITFNMKAIDDSENDLVSHDLKAQHTPQIKFVNIGIQRVDPKSQRKTVRSKYANMIPIRLPKDANLDVEKWYIDNEDKFETPEEMEAAAANLFDLYYVDPLTSKTEIAVRCTCLDYNHTFAKANKKKGAHFGRVKNFPKFDGDDEINPEDDAGFCAHIRFGLEMLQQYELFWQSKVKLSGTKDHKVNSRDIGVWADFAGY